MGALHEARYRAAKLDMQSTSDFPSVLCFSASSSSSSCTSSPSTAFIPDLDMIPIQKPTSIPQKYNRKLPILGLNKLGLLSQSSRSSACSTPSTATAAELGGCSHGTLLKPSLKTAALEEETNFNSMIDMATSMVYSDVLATNNSAMNLSPPSSVSSETLAITTPDNALKLNGIASSPVIPVSLSGKDITRADVSHAAEDVALSYPPGSSSSLASSSSSTSVSTEHSSYSATHSADPAVSSVIDVPRRGTKRKIAPASARIEACIGSASLRPLGPAHLEHDYTVAHKAFSAAVAIAAYELFGFSVPIRNAETEAKRPGKDAFPVLHAHPLVRQAAFTLNKADDALEAALERGETFENTPIPDKWRWGSDYLRPHEWAKLEPEPAIETKCRRTSTRIGPSQASEPRTRSQKRKALEADADEKVIKEEDAELDFHEETTALNSACASSPSTATPAVIAVKTMPEPDSLPAPSSISTFLSSSFVVPMTTDSSLPPSPEKRKRGRPRKNASKPSSTATQTTAASTPNPNLTAAASVTTSPACTESSASTPVKRGRGRPRRHPFPPTVPSSSPSKSSAATATPALAPHQSKRRRIIFSDLEFS